MTTTLKPLVLAVDDEKGVTKVIKVELEAQGFRVITADAGGQALRLAEEQRPDIILLDVLMPDMTGLEVMRKLKDELDVPVLLVTGKDSPMDKLRGLELGADDYIVKPFSIEELGARLRAILRRTRGPVEALPVIKTGDLELDVSRRVATRSGQLISLTRTEWQLLEQLVANSGKVMLASELLTKVWGPEYREDLEYLRVWVSRLRHKIETDPASPKLLKTIAGIGYMLDLEDMGAAAPAQ